jgi:hypothetical protein
MKRVHLQGVEVPAYSDVVLWLEQLAASGHPGAAVSPEVEARLELLAQIEQAAANSPELRATIQRLQVMMKKGSPL